MANMLLCYLYEYIGFGKEDCVTFSWCVCDDGVWILYLELFVWSPLGYSLDWTYGEGTHYIYDMSATKG